VAKATTPTSAPGSRRPGPARGAGAPARGFTLIELLVVVALIAIASTVTALALRDPSVTRLEREAARLAALLEGARAESRAAGIPVLWMPVRDGGFRFVGLPRSVQLPTQWLGEGMSAEVLNTRGAAPAAVLGPEPLIGAQRIVLRLDSQSLMLATDGLGPFAISPKRDDDASR
jgi:general secretion pathway protein H